MILFRLICCLIFFLRIIFLKRSSNLLLICWVSWLPLLNLGLLPSEIWIPNLRTPLWFFGATLSVKVILSITLTIFLTKVSSFTSDDEEGSSLIVILFLTLNLDFLANRLASTLTSFFCISSLSTDRPFQHQNHLDMEANPILVGALFMLE